jgi:CRISPR-associated endonuclease/helicase Cas3
MHAPSFHAIFRALTDNDPFPWQEKLFSRLAAGDLPRHCDVPTGLGKTSVIAVWLAALAASLLAPERCGRVPRRLAYIVDIPGISWLPKRRHLAET